VSKPDYFTICAYLTNSADDAECFEVQDWVRRVGRDVAEVEFAAVKRAEKL
jgi:hypothetical protein